MMRTLLLASLLALPAFAGEPISVNSNQHQTAVLELYTSEGCSSCPPADRWLEKLVTTPQADLDVLALAFHVDYWNYLGWEDRFSSPAYTKRQRVLGANNQQRTIYTPEFFVLNRERKIVYMGAMDDNTDAKKVKKRYVELAIQSALQGGDLKTKETVAIGCRVRFERKRRRRKK